MEERAQFSQLNRFLIGTASLGVTLLVINHYAGFIAVIIVSILLAILFAPLLSWLQQKKIPAVMAFVLTMALVVLIMVALFLFLVFSVSQLSEAVPVYTAEMDILKIQVQETLANWGIDLSESTNLFALIEPERLVDIVAELLSSLLGLLSDGLTVLLALAFLLIGTSSFSNKVNNLIKQGTPGLKRLYQFNSDIRQYILITNNVGLAAAAINTVLLAVIGVDFAVLWGVLSYLMSYIPYIGFILALIPPVILALLEFGWPTAVFIIIFYIVINFAIDNVVKPRLMGRGLDLAPIIVFISVIFWGLILGPLGGLLAVPVTVGVKQLVLEPDPDNRWIAELIGDGDGQETAAEINEEPTNKEGK